MSFMFRILDPKNGLAAARARAAETWLVSHKKRRPSQADALQVSQLLWRAGRAGTHIGTLCNLIYNQLGEPGVRRVFGILSLAKKFRHRHGRRGVRGCSGNGRA